MVAATVGLRQLKDEGGGFGLRAIGRPLSCSARVSLVSNKERQCNAR